MVRSDDTYAKDRIRSARLKLNGINPAVITGYVLGRTEGKTERRWYR